MINKYAKLEKSLGYSFSNKDHLIRALTHRSVGSEKNNERYEFFGDSLLGVIISSHLFDMFDKEPEGSLSRMRSSLVREQTLAEIAHTFGLSDYLIMGKGEMKSGGFRRDSILADAVEAIICAIYLDSNHNLELLDNILSNWFTDLLQNITPGKQKDSKSRLQEYLQGRHLPLPTYELFNTVGQAHKQIFTIVCKIECLNKTFTGIGSSIKRAEQDAASKVLAELNSK